MMVRVVLRKRIGNAYCADTVEGLRKVDADFGILGRST